MGKINPNDERQFTRLKNAVQNHRKQLGPFRSNATEFARELLGHNFSDNATADRVPINLIELAVSIYKRFLVSQNPSTTVRTRLDARKPAAANLQAEINQDIREMDLYESLDEWVLQAMLGIGILKVGIAEGEHEGFLHDPGQPFADVVLLDDWVHDFTATCYEKTRYVGNRWYIDIDDAKEQGLLDGLPRHERDISGDDIRRDTNEDGYEKMAALSHKDANIDSLTDQLELWDLWLPRENLIVTMCLDRFSKPLAVTDWNGPERGPYHLLRLAKAPASVMALPPAALMYDLHTLANDLYNKLGRQAIRQKDLTVVQRGAERDAKREIDAPDGGVLTSDKPDATRQVRRGGIDNSNLAFVLNVKDMAFSIPGGNLDALGGLSPQAETLGQDQLLTQAASKRVEEYQSRTLKATGFVVEDLGWYQWYSPFVDKEIEKPIPGTQRTIAVRVTADDREGDWMDYNIQIIPHSMRSRTPGEILQFIFRYVNEIAAPMVPFMQEQGLTLDMVALTRIVAEYSDTHELTQIITPVEIDQTERGEAPRRLRQAPNTTRTNVRVNRPGRSRQSSEAALSTALLGAGQQQSELDQVGRPIG
jgi:hypothetical protein